MQASSKHTLTAIAEFFLFFRRNTSFRWHSLFVQCTATSQTPPTAAMLLVNPRKPFFWSQISHGFNFLCSAEASKSCTIRSYCAALTSSPFVPSIALGFRNSSISRRLWIVVRRLLQQSLVRSLVFTHSQSPRSQPSMLVEPLRGRRRRMTYNFDQLRPYPTTRMAESLLFFIPARQPVSATSQSP